MSLVRPRSPGRRTRRIALAVTAALLAVPAVASAQPAPPGAVGTELTSKRTAFSKTWNAKNGQRVTRLSAERLHWRDARGNWKPFDLKPRPGATPGRSEVRVGAATVSIPDAQAASRDIIVRDGRDTVRLALEGTQKRLRLRGGREWVADGVLPGVTQRLRVTAEGPKEDLVLADARSPRKFGYRLTLTDGLTPVVTVAGDLAIMRGTKQRFSIPRAVLFEQGSPGTKSVGNPYALRKVGNGAWRVTLDADVPWMRDKARAWPVVVDPLISIDSMSTAMECQQYRTPAMTTPPYMIRMRCIGGVGPAQALTSDQVEVGLFDQVAGLLEYRFPMPGILVPDDVVEARLRFNLSEVDGSDAKGRRLQLHARTGSGWWEFANPGTEPWILSPPADVRTAADGPIAFNLTKEVRGWIRTQVDPSNSHFFNNGVVLKFANAVPPRNSSGTAWAWTPESWGRAKVATTNHTDPAKRPALDIYSALPAQAGSEITSPEEGKNSSRFVELYSRATSPNVTSASFEYIAGTDREWRPIPLEALRYTDSGEQPTNADIAVSGSGSNRSSESLVWDLHKTPGAQVDGPIHVRAHLDSGANSGGGLSPVRNFRVDRKNPIASSLIEAGPGEIDLLTGDLVVTETDAKVQAFTSDLELTRTYHSRGGSPRTHDMFGPGWVSGFDTDGGKMPYRSIYNFTEVTETEELVGWEVDDTLLWETYDIDDLAIEPIYETTRFETKYAAVELTNGSKITFQEKAGAWVSPPEHPDLKLRPNGANLELVDSDRGVTNFVPEAAGSPRFRPSAYRPAGAPSSITMDYETVGGRNRLMRIVAPRLNGVTCSFTGWTSGCRALELDWMSMTVAGKTEWRVREVRLRAADPSGSTTATSHPLVTYAYHPDGRLKSVTDATGASTAPTEYEYDASGRMTSYKERGERPWTFAYETIPGDDGTGRIRSVTRKTPAGADATTTLVYDVPLAGAAAPNDMSRTATASWGQNDKPWTGTAVFPPDAAPGSGTPTSWERATVHYLGVHGKTVNVADAEHNIDTTQYDQNHNVVRELTARNRERALAATGSTAARAERLSTISTYRTNGIDLFQVRGPERQIRKPDGTTVVGYERTRYGYDNGKPPTLEGDQHLVTEKRTDAQLLDGSGLDPQVTTYEYSGGNNRGWTLRQPTKVTVGEGTEAATTSYEYHATYPVLVEKRMPKAVGSDSHATRYHYYGIGTPPAWCSGGAGLADAAAAGGLLCAAVPAAQPAAGPDRLGKYFRYRWLWDEVELREATSESTVASAPRRVTTLGRDALGRETSRAVTATSGRAIPTVTTTYDASSGRVRNTSTGTGPSAQSISRTWDDNGRLASYDDGSGSTTTYAYDLNGRTTAIQDSRGTRTLGYDDRDLVATVTDSNLSGPIIATRDADGELVRQELPDDIRLTREVNESGVPVLLRWEKTSACGSSCLLAESAVERDAHGRVSQHQTDGLTQSFAYDGLGRLATTHERRGVVCTAREYQFDRNSNRTSLQQKVSAPTGDCGTGTATTKSNTLDGADRLTNAGYAYDELGRTTSLPGADAPSGSDVALTYDTDDLVASITSGAAEQAITRDPLRRMRTETSEDVGLSSSTGTLHYGDDEDRPVARAVAGEWQRYVGDADGGQVATVTDDGAVTWELSDLQGSIVGTVESGGSAVSQRVDFGEFGTVSWLSGPVSSSALSFGWLGGYAKQSAFVPGGLVHMGARVYNPTSGRFLQVDPVDGGSANAYDYAMQDPLQILDLDGRKSKLKKLWEKTKKTVSKAAKTAAKVATCAGSVGVAVGAGGYVVRSVKALGGIRQTAKLLVKAGNKTDFMKAAGGVGASILGIDGIAKHCF